MYDSLCTPQMTDGAGVNKVTFVPLNVGIETTQRRIGEDEAMTMKLMIWAEEREKEKKVRKSTRDEVFINDGVIWVFRKGADC